MRLARRIDTAESSRICVESGGRFQWVERRADGIPEPSIRVVKRAPELKFLSRPAPLDDGSFLITTRRSPRLLFDTIFVGPSAALFGVQPDAAADPSLSLAAVGHGLGAVAAATARDSPTMRSRDADIELFDEFAREDSAGLDRTVICLARRGIELMRVAGRRSVSHGRCSTMYLGDATCGEDVQLFGWLQAANRHPLFDVANLANELLEGLALRDEGVDVRVAPADVRTLIDGFRLGAAGRVPVLTADLRALVAFHAVVHEARERRRNTAGGRSGSFQRRLRHLIIDLEVDR